MQLGDLALDQRHEPDTGETQLLEEGRDIFLIAGQPVESLGQHHVETTLATSYRRC